MEITIEKITESFKAATLKQMELAKMNSVEPAMLDAIRENVKYMLHVPHIFFSETQS